MPDLDDFPKGLQEHAVKAFTKATELVDELVNTKFFEDQETYPPTVMFFALTMLQKEYKAFMLETSPLPEIGKFITDKLEHDMEKWVSEKAKDSKIKSKFGTGIAIPLSSETAREILDLIKRRVKGGNINKMDGEKLN